MTVSGANPPFSKFKKKPGAIESWAQPGTFAPGFFFKTLKIDEVGFSAQGGGGGDCVVSLNSRCLAVRKVLLSPSYCFIR